MNTNSLTKLDYSTTIDHSMVEKIMNLLLKSFNFSNCIKT